MQANHNIKLIASLVGLLLLSIACGSTATATPSQTDAAKLPSAANLPSAVPTVPTIQVTPVTATIVPLASATPQLGLFDIRHMFSQVEGEPLRSGLLAITVNSGASSAGITVSVNAEKALVFQSAISTSETIEMFPFESRQLLYNYHLISETILSGEYVTVVKVNDGEQLYEKRIKSFVVAEGNSNRKFVANQEEFDALFRESHMLEHSRFDAKIALEKRDQPTRGILTIRVPSSHDNYTPFIRVVVLGGITFESDVNVNVDSSGKIATVSLDAIAESGSRVIDFPFVLDRSSREGTYSFKLMVRSDEQEVVDYLPYAVRLSSSAIKTGTAWLSIQQIQAPRNTPQPTSLPRPTLTSQPRLSATPVAVKNTNSIQVKSASTKFGKIVGGQTTLDLTLDGIGKDSSVIKGSMNVVVYDNTLAKTQQIEIRGDLIGPLFKDQLRGFSPSSLGLFTVDQTNYVRLDSLVTVCVKPKGGIPELDAISSGVRMDSFLTMFGDGSLPGILVGEEKVDNISAKRYVLDLAELKAIAQKRGLSNLPGLSRGEIWVAVDGDYLVQVSIEGKLKLSDTAGVAFDGDFALKMRSSNVNTKYSIELPASCNRPIELS